MDLKGHEDPFVFSLILGLFLLGYRHGLISLLVYLSCILPYCLLSLAVDELGYSGDDVARRLRISGRGVSDCRERGKKILDNPKIISEYLT